MTSNRNRVEQVKRRMLFQEMLLRRDAVYYRLRKAINNDNPDDLKAHSDNLKTLWKSFREADKELDELVDVLVGESSRSIKL